MHGKRPKNFEITFTDDTINVYLNIDEYAVSSDAEPGEWCLMSGTKGKAKAKAKGKGKG